ncbi:RNA polymerase sigma factor [Spirochaetota bacterium]
MTEKEFAQIVNSTKNIVLSAISKNLAERFCYSIDDVAQETYIRAYNSLVKNKFRGDSSLNTWLYKIAQNEALRMNKKLGREEEKFLKSIEKIKLSSLNSEPEEIDLDLNYIYEMIDKLPEIYRQVLQLASKGFREREISQKLNIKMGTVKSRKSRGREMLQRLLCGG